MEYRQLGNSDIHASVITFGAWAIGGAFWGGADDDKAIEAIHASIDLGITSIDTAPMYGCGKSEQLVGKAVAGIRDKVHIFTKFGMNWTMTEGEFFFDLREGDKSTQVYRNAKKDGIIYECEVSLKKLRTDYIDLYQCHWRDHTTPVEETMEALEQLIQQGKIRAAGVCNFNVDEIETARQSGPLTSVQPPYSMVRRDIEKDVLPYCREHNIGVVVYSPMQRGLLTGKFRPDHQFASGDSRANERYFKPENVRRVNAFLDQLRPIASDYNATVGQIVLNWTIRQPGITAALVGARDAVQARENAAAVNFTLSDSDFLQINHLLEKLELE